MLPLMWMARSWLGTIHGHSQLSQTPDVVPDDPLLLLWVQNWPMLVVIRLAGGQYLIDQVRQLMRYSHHGWRLFPSAFRDDTPELFLQKARFC